MFLKRVFLATSLSLAAPSAQADILVFAAASLKEPLDQIADSFGDVTMSYGGSGTLSRQVSFGAPADVVLLANVGWMDVLVADGHVKPDSVADFASNALVMIGPSGADVLPLEPVAIDAALADGRIALGLTQAVPAGIYAKAGLLSLGLWDVLADRLAEVDNVRAALALVIRGQAPLGIVYKTDVRISDAVVAVASFPAESHPPIRYVGAVTANADPEAIDFMDFVLSAQGQAILAKAGFLAPVDTSQ